MGWKYCAECCMYLGCPSSPDAVENQPGGLYASGWEVVVFSCHKSPVENKENNKCKQSALTSKRDISTYKATWWLYPYALLVLQAWHSQNHSLGPQPFALGPSPQEERWRLGTVLGSGRSGHLFLCTLVMLKHTHTQAHIMKLRK